MENEIWKDIKGFEGIYQISNQGRVRSLDRVVIFKNGASRKYKGQILSKMISKYGYERVDLRMNGKHKIYSVHRLVAEAFIPNPEGKETVNHKDENKQNNCVDNLEWMTIKENSNYGTRNMRMAKSQGQKVRCIETGKIYYSLTEAERQTGIDRHRISRVCKGLQEMTIGTHWEYC